MLTIYEVIENFFEWVFPSTVYIYYEPIIQFTIFVLTYVVIFGLFLIPLWKLGTIWLPKGRKK
jgi:hypothetical protein